MNREKSTKSNAQSLGKNTKINKTDKGLVRPVKRKQKKTQVTDTTNKRRAVAANCTEIEG